jgi:hypothetical protein
MTAETAGNFRCSFVTGLVHIGCDEDFFEPLQPLEFILDPLLLASAATTEWQRQGWEAIWRHGQRVDFALSKHHLAGVIGYGLPTKQDRLTIGCGRLGRRTVHRLPRLDQRQRSVRQKERKHDPVAVLADLVAIEYLARNVALLPEIVEHARLRLDASRLRRAHIGGLRIAIGLTPLNSEEHSRLFKRLRQGQPLDDAPQVEQIAALAGREVPPHTGLLTGEMHTEAPPLLTPNRACTPFPAFLAPAWQEHFGHHLGAIGQHAFEVRDVGHIAPR